MARKVFRHTNERGARTEPFFSFLRHAALENKGDRIDIYWQSNPSPAALRPVTRPPRRSGAAVGSAEADAKMLSTTARVA